MFQVLEHLADFAETLDVANQPLMRASSCHRRERKCIVEFSTCNSCGLLQPPFRVEFNLGTHTSILEATIEVFQNFILEGNHAVLALPPFRARLIRWFKGGNFKAHRASGKFTIKDPPYTTSRKNFSRNDDPRDAMLINPVSQSDRFVSRVLIRMPKRFDCGVWHTKL